MITTKNLSNKKRILFIVSTPMVIDFFMLKILKSIKKNFIVTIVCNRDHDSEGFEKLAKFFHVNHIPIERDINLYKDLICLFKLLNFLIFTRLPCLWLVLFVAFFLHAAKYLLVIPVLVRIAER